MASSVEALSFKVVVANAEVAEGPLFIWATTASANRACYEFSSSTVTYLPFQNPVCILQHLFLQEMRAGCSGIYWISVETESQSSIAAVILPFSLSRKVHQVTLESAKCK